MLLAPDEAPAGAAVFSPEGALVKGRFRVRGGIDLEFLVDELSALDGTELDDGYVRTTHFVATDFDDGTEYLTVTVTVEGSRLASTCPLLRSWLSSTQSASTARSGRSSTGCRTASISP